MGFPYQMPEPPLDPPEPRVVCDCDMCGEEICEGNYAYRINDSIICQFCIDNACFIAGMEDEG